MAKKELNLTTRFREYTFEQDKTKCRNCRPPRWLIVANYELTYFPLGETYEGIEVATLKVKVNSYKNLKDAKRALYTGRMKNIEIKFSGVKYD